MRVDLPQEGQTDIKSLLERNIALSEEILKHARKTHHHLIWSRFFGLVKLGIILTPLIAAAWFLPQYFKQAAGMATDISKQFQFVQAQLQQLGNLQKQAGQLQKQIPTR